ncbi:glycosyltransferase [Thiocapsa sp. UBA6158]|uniref:glycosyltransferase n=1 Tax=Thiocapsa sp. UBA6158 TaxID=1947692 RepID=UPI0025CF91AE|nr:glycosyltransferase [Thiocapsa sp. UBA6158]
MTDPAATKKPFRIVFWGTYDLGKPRVRILLQGLRENGVDILECHEQVWAGIEDKTQIVSLRIKLRLLLRWLSHYPGLIWRYLRLPPHDAVIVGYFGHLDVLLIWPFAKLRRAPLAWDAFLSLYDTAVNDRKLVGRRHPLAAFLYAWEWLACRAADIVLLDTNAHRHYFIDTFKVRPEKVKHVFVGAETEYFHPPANGRVPRDLARPFTVLFYGQFIPLHGIDTVVRAAKLTEGQPIRWVLIGKGQESSRIRRLIDDLQSRNIEWYEWVPYNELVHWIHQADVCLGVFGTSEKASRVIPNKAFQVLAAGGTLITMDSPAARELLIDYPGVTLLPQASHEDLARKISEFAALGIPSRQASRIPCNSDRITPRNVTSPLLNALRSIVLSRSSNA